MTRSCWPIRLSLVAILAGPLVLAGALAGQQPRPEGAWRLDPSHSDSLGTRLGRSGTPTVPPSDRPGVDGPGGEGPGGTGPGYGPPVTGGPGTEPGGGGEIGRGRRFGGSRYGRPMNAKDLVRMRQTFDLVRTVPAQVRISIGEGTFTTIDSGGEERTLRIGQTDVTPAVDSGGSVKTTAKWKGDALVVERKVDGGGRVKESYGLGLDGSRMIVFVELTIGVTPRSFTRQYVKSEE